MMPSAQPDLRNVTSADVARFLRALLGLDPDKPAPGERAADLRRPLPDTIEGLNAGAWIAWCLAGLPVFSSDPPMRLPSVRAVKATAARVVIAVAMLHSGGNLSQACRFTRTTRKVFRDNLKMLGLYPWHRAPVGIPTEGKAAQ